ncbi:MULTISPECIES: tyrosine-type recombinase/integrase [Pseudonocardia]|uniref:Tyrosine recombinase XerD n=2 Tax=Pseudonocardia TaxID=1847 RepID=A0A1Y2MW41_PSEAH|nr:MULTISPECIES: site-specific integrase [Pseudonocardia]OSY39382.1 Tyrosine recombinase XerD [Pseudonocardia autotrophica]TDN75380.1 site-specific recombinase XerD [Pseudonocardia autotrophica]BBF99326.1 phage integrase [Pseudonocardia autotrophica]GEC28658.1 phage integrase [Pseudonocardia saturnea]
MARPPMPLGSYGAITAWEDGSGWVAKTRFRDFDGVSRQVKRRGRSKAAAIRALRAALVDRQTPVKESEVVPDTRFGKVADLWLAEVEEAVESGRRSPGTLDIYRSIYRRHVRPALADLRVREITTPVVDRALGVIKQRSSSRARTAKIVISGVMKLAARHGAIAYNPVREVARIDSEPRRPPRSLTAAERTAWLDAVEQSTKARDWDLPDLTRMMLATGVRIGEALAVGWSEVDLDEGVVDVRWRLVRRTGVGLLRLPSTKSGRKGERLVPIPSWGLTMLKRRRLAIGPGVEAVFPDSLGGWRDPANVRRVWRQVRDNAELDGLVSHTLRKTVASFLDDANVTVRKISDQLGHSKISMTQDRYLGRRLTDRETAEVLEGMFDRDGDG